MNPVTVTEDLMYAIDVAYPDFQRERVGPMQKMVRPSPLLTYAFSDDDWLAEVQKMETLAALGVAIFPTPFPCFRYWIKAGNHTVWAGCVDRHDAGLGIVCVITDAAKAKVVLKVFVHPPRIPGKTSWNCRMFRFDDGKEITTGKHGRGHLPPDMQKKIDRTVIVCITVLHLMCRDYLRPSNFVARVSPEDRPGKSVEWVQAREHYTIIHRTHAANSKNVAQGEVVEQNEEKHILRVAHTRRAHERVLRSEKFKYMRGQTIQIKATWVGPPEWKNTAGQIYRIVERK